ncbi:hypothetical protein CO038_03515 [Candidatus Pacearchaeota archaeon CG_4_9_14_0_2_um_filter_39_13]|nr:hypothetical protein [Candidatus Pacearchaeota archaeon]OIO43604.1 MAG: hypothetical protein AUJ64_02000 [Candidatus Pacearchaeota archaeon CG1_02_39_14]PJC44486.1 MAG: hypothetical protein CO038_03515 [Candidatus Pacearchaeota archaeon CG_4_9_14_0_2_um_filter_39_13]
MKHTKKVTFILLGMFLIAQLIGIFVANAYAPEITSVINETTGEVTTVEEYPSLPGLFQPPSDVSPASATTSIVIALIVAVCLMLLLMKLRAEVFLRAWFFVVIAIGIALAVNAFVIRFPNSFIIAFIIAIPLTIIKVFKRDIIVHNLTELLIYPGIASVFIPLLSIWTVVLLLILISLYDIYAVWHAGFMQKMAKYQMEQVKVFSGFFVPYIRKKDRLAIKKAQQSKSKAKGVKISVAILGGGDVVFPIILAGVVLHTLGLAQALIIALGATIALGFLFYNSEKGKFYPAMPFITAGLLVALGIAYLI